MTNSNTNGTVRTQDTSILDTPSGGRIGRRSFFGSVSRREGNKSTHEAVLAPVVNGKKDGGRGRGNSATSKDGSQYDGTGSKENRRSFFSANGVSLGRGRASVKEEEDGREWVTQSDLSTVSSAGAGGGSGVGRRSSSSHQRPTTAKSSGAGTGTGTASSVGSRVGSVRKRLSLLKLGKKTSKASVLVDSVTEEE